MEVRFRENIFPAGGDAMLNAVLIGVSGFGDVHYRDLLRWHHAGRLRFSAAAVINKAEQQEKCAEMNALGIRIYDDYRHMLNSEKADLCCIPTGIAMHAPMSIAAMRAGMNVLVEKPAAAVMADVKAIQETEKETGHFTAVAFQDIYRPEILRLKRLILNGIIGKIAHVTVCASSTSGDFYYRRNNWAGKLYCNGMPIFDSPFMNGNAHQLNLAFFLCGTTFDTSIGIRSVSGELYRIQKIESFDTGAVHAAAENGIDFFFILSKSAETPLPYRIILRGTRGRIAISPKAISLPDGRRIPMEQDAMKIRDNILRNLLGHINSVPGSFLVNMNIAGTHVHCIELMHKTLPISTVNPEYVASRNLTDDRDMIFLRGINEIIKQCASKHVMPSIRAPELFHMNHGEAGPGEKKCNAPQGVIQQKQFPE